MGVQGDLVAFKKSVDEPGDIVNLDPSSLKLGGWVYQGKHIKAYVVDTVRVRMAGWLDGFPPIIFHYREETRMRPPLLKNNTRQAAQRNGEEHSRDIKHFVVILYSQRRRCPSIHAPLNDYLLSSI